MPQVPNRAGAQPDKPKPEPDESRPKESLNLKIAEVVPLGEGAEGIVLRVKLQKGNTYAVKILKPDDKFNKQQWPRLIRNIAIIQGMPPITREIRVGPNTTICTDIKLAEPLKEKVRLELLNGIREVATAENWLNSFMHELKKLAQLFQARALTDILPFTLVMPLGKNEIDPKAAELLKNDPELAFRITYLVGVWAPLVVQRRLVENNLFGPGDFGQNGNAPFTKITYKDRNEGRNEAPNDTRHQGDHQKTIGIQIVIPDTTLYLPPQPEEDTHWFSVPIIERLNFEDLESVLRSDPYELLHELKLPEGINNPFQRAEVEFGNFRISLPILPELIFNLWRALDEDLAKHRQLPWETAKAIQLYVLDKLINSLEEKLMPQTSETTGPLKGSEESQESEEFRKFYDNIKNQLPDLSREQLEEFQKYYERAKKLTNQLLRIMEKYYLGVKGDIPEDESSNFWQFLTNLGVRSSIKLGSNESEKSNFLQSIVELVNKIIDSFPKRRKLQAVSEPYGTTFQRHPLNAVEIYVTKERFKFSSNQLFWYLLTDRREVTNYSEKEGIIKSLRPALDFLLSGDQKAAPQVIIFPNLTIPQIVDKLITELNQEQQFTSEENNLIRLMAKTIVMLLYKTGMIFPNKAIIKAKEPRKKINPGFLQVISVKGKLIFTRFESNEGSGNDRLTVQQIAIYDPITQEAYVITKDDRFGKLTGEIFSPSDDKSIWLYLCGYDRPPNTSPLNPSEAERLKAIKENLTQHFK